MLRESVPQWQAMLKSIYEHTHMHSHFLNQPGRSQSEAYRVSHVLALSAPSPRGTPDASLPIHPLGRSNFSGKYLTTGLSSRVLHVLSDVAPAAVYDLSPALDG